ncbi:NrsF family protein [Halomonas sp. 328]|uniref:NrsF family protein n=1 Tax=Halomonas sp. 328 TaxID=2776704 RepID=UPI0018A6F71B|nr:NrsF family protein [Halomonas sp. 328]MBF8223139.1 DUF1109 family protein [Halomonas sp. 328]
MFAPDVLAELLRLVGATLLLCALGQQWLGESRPTPLTTALAGTLLLALGSLALLLATTGPLARRLEEPWLPLTLEYLHMTRHGQALFTPLLPALYALLLLEGLRGVTAPRPRRALYAMLGATLATIPALMAAGGHALGAPGGHPAMLALMVHLISALAWIALVLCLLLRLARGAPLGASLSRVGNLALALVIGLLASGLLVAWWHGARPPLSSAYEELLLAKLGLLAAALGAAAWNRFRELPRPDGHERNLRRVLGLEALLLLTLLPLAAWLARTPPPT